VSVVPQLVVEGRVVRTDGDTRLVGSCAACPALWDESARKPAPRIAALELDRDRADAELSSLRHALNDAARLDGTVNLQSLILNTLRDQPGNLVAENAQDELRAMAQELARMRPVVEAAVARRLCNPCGCDGCEALRRATFDFIASQDPEPKMAPHRAAKVT